MDSHLKTKAWQEEVKGHLQNSVRCVFPEHLFIDNVINLDRTNIILKELRKFLRVPDDLGVISGLLAFMRRIC